MDVPGVSAWSALGVESDREVRAEPLPRHEGGRHPATGIYLFANGTFSDEDGELALTIPGGISEVRFLPGKNGNAADSTGSGVVREREALRMLAANGWLDARVEGTTLKIRLGEHAKAVRAGKEEVPAGA
jgi:hypothetical protein